MRWGLAILLVLSAPIALWAGAFTPDAFMSAITPGRASSVDWGIAWLSFVAPPVWLFGAYRCVQTWRRPDRTGTKADGLLLVALTAGALISLLFIYVLWAWSQM